MFSYGKNSARKLLDGTVDLQLILNRSIGLSTVDWGISQVARTFDEQLEFFLAGRTKLDPRVPSMLANAKHVTTAERPKAEAADLFIYHPDKAIRAKLAYDIPSLSYVAGIIQATARMMYDAGEVEHLIRWGGNWDRDGVILMDQSFDDLPHVETYRP